MFKLFVVTSLLPILVSFTTCGFADDNVLFNGTSLEGWTCEFREAEEEALPVEAAWGVQDGLLVSTGMCASILKHETDFEDYVLTLEYRSMLQNENGITVGGSGSVFVHASNEKGAFSCPKSVEIALFNGVGSVYFRDVEPSSEKEWAFRAPDFADDIEKDLGEWNQLKLICRGNKLTVFVNGTPVNQAEGLNLTKGTIALSSQTGFIPAPTFYRNIRVQNLPDDTAQVEEFATAQLAKFKALKEEKDAARTAMRLEEENRETMRAEAFEREWATVDVSQEINFSADALKLPFPADGNALEFQAAFGDISLESKTSMVELSKFYRTEMAKRGWKEGDRERDEDSIEITFKHDQAEVNLRLNQDSDGVDIRLDCRGMSFEGTRDPAAMAAMGLPQPPAYLFLQKEFQLPASVRDLEFESGDRCLFKCDLGLQETFDQLGQQLLAKGYHETRRPIVTDDRRYTGFAKGPIKVSINLFVHESGSRAILRYEGK